MFQSSSGQERTSTRRRELLMGGFAGAVGCAFPLVSHAATALVLPTAAADRRFSVKYKGIRIGTHAVSYSSATGETRVKTQINLEVKVAFITAYAFSHRSEETWRAGRLVSLNSETVEHGEPLHVEGTATPQGFRVASKGGPFIASAATLTSNSLWTPAMLEQTTVVDAQRGGVIGEDTLDQRQSVLPAERKPAHVADVEQPRPRSNRLMLVNNARILHRHVPTREIDHAGAMSDMPVVKGRL